MWAKEDQIHCTSAASPPPPPFFASVCKRRRRIHGSLILHSTVPPPQQQPFTNAFSMFDLLLSHCYYHLRLCTSVSSAPLSVSPRHRHHLLTISYCFGRPTLNVERNKTSADERPCRRTHWVTLCGSLHRLQQQQQQQHFVIEAKTWLALLLLTTIRFILLQQQQQIDRLFDASSRFINNKVQYLPAKYRSFFLTLLLANSQNHKSNNIRVRYKFPRQQQSS